MTKKKRAFISFDYDHDLDLKTLLVGQANKQDSPFNTADFSIKEAISKDWKPKTTTRIKGAEVVIVICGQNTDTAAGVSAEVGFAQEENVDHFLLWGCTGETCKKPKAAKSSDKISEWTWDNLKSLVHGAR
ncbi:MAG: TIR domain-containing protein [Candidatus Hodarchaeota archaeon]